MIGDDDEVPPLVQKERRRGAALTIVALGLLLGVVLFFLFGEEYLDRVPPEPTDIKVEVKPGDES